MSKNSKFRQNSGYKRQELGNYWRVISLSRNFVTKSNRFRAEFCEIEYFCEFRIMDRYQRMVFFISGGIPWRLLFLEVTTHLSCTWTARAFKFVPSESYGYSRNFFFCEISPRQWKIWKYKNIRNSVWT